MGGLPLTELNLLLLRAGTSQITVRGECSFISLIALMREMLFLIYHTVNRLCLLCMWTGVSVFTPEMPMLMMSFVLNETNLTCTVNHSNLALEACSIAGFHFYPTVN